MSDVIQEYQDKIDGYKVETEVWDDELVTWSISELHPIEQGKEYAPETCRRFSHTIGSNGRTFGVVGVKSGESDGVEEAKRDIKKAVEELKKAS